ncbi:MAG: ABC transporter ATP-binding protein [Thermodesulfobacteriota bacterium]|nr:ABC transporter ATP-binding protein [Thermodesulfobacteriota bacterium]
MYAIETLDLTKIFKPARNILSLKSPQSKTITAINKLNLRIKKGEIFAVLGPNGAGKTTLIKIMCSLITPSSGTALIHGYDVVKDETKIKSLVGLVIGEERSFYWRLTGRENLEFFGVLNNLSLQQARERSHTLMKLLEIEDPDKRFHEYSSGNKQKLALGRCLLSNSEVIFMDEPTKSLDPGIASRFRTFVKEILVKKENKTVFFATHSIQEAEELADRIAIMDYGSIKVCGSIDEFNAGGTSMLDIYNRFT